MTSISDDTFTAMMDWNPLFAGLVGVPGWEDQVAVVSVEGEQALRTRLVDLLQRIETSDEDAVTLAVCRNQVESILTKIDARLVEHTVATGLEATVPGLLALISQVDNSRRLDAVPVFLREHAARLTDSERRPLHRHALAAAGTIEKFLAAPVTEWEGDRSDVLRPEFARYREVLLSLEGRDDEKVGICWLPDGETNYANLVRDYTTAPYGPQELHDLGLALIAELREEYATIGSRVWGTSSVPEIFAKLRTDLLWDSEEGMVAAAYEALERANAVAPQWFGRLPKAPCEVRLVPEAERATAAMAYYVDAAMDGTRPGVYWLNPLGATERSRTQSDVILFHEAVPGHHLQLTIAAETEMSNLRKFAFCEAYIEGWGLYAERLADEMGLYTSDEGRLGMLSADALRAARLVVDTGMHALGWTRQQAIDYLRDNTVMPEPEIQLEIDRYIEVPGQALAYMVGRREIQRIREKAAAALGERFDIRAFHDVVLESGPVPLSALDDIVTAWTASP